ncbi:MAG TPA: type II secretion system major pseudopilin GspG [Alphaproteobacteria bacterium]|nr:type II secretion system major pseudopilin GspG [Alphaproteobacteria bacterium]
MLSLMRDRRGFTLLELLVVLAVMGLLAAIALPRVVGYFGRAKGEVAKIEIETIRAGLDLFRIDMGRYPAAAEGVAALVKAPAGGSRWRGPYLKNGEPPRDPWGNPYVYEQRAGDPPFRLYSLGADGRPGGEGEAADIGLR